MADETKQDEQQAAPADILAMSDEEMANLNSPSEVTGAADAASETTTDAATTDTGDKTEPAAGEGEAATAAEATAEAAGGKAEPEAKPGEEVQTDAKTEEKTADKADTTGSESEKTADKVEETPINYQEAYDKVMSFKANGKNITLKSVDEAIQLMQMGANYTRKLQELQPHKKIVTMLANNGLLDEGKLSYLIDLDKKDPEAIKKLVKDAGIDILDIDTSVDPAYKPGNHQVTDAEVNFRTATDELVALPGGLETVSTIHDTWDDTSKEALWENPSLLAVIHGQRESGAYAKIMEEMDRQITLGNISPNLPFLERYTQVGDAMIAAIKAKQPETEAQPGTTEELPGSGPQPIATRAAAPKTPLANDDKAKAASPTRAAPSKAGVVKNPLAESDEDFLKQMNGRL